MRQWLLPDDYNNLEKSTQVQGHCPQPRVWMVPQQGDRRGLLWNVNHWPWCLNAEVGYETMKEKKVELVQLDSQICSFPALLVSGTWKNFIINGRMDGFNNILSKSKKRTSQCGPCLSWHSFLFPWLPCLPHPPPAAVSFICESEGDHACFTYPCVLSVFT